MNNCVAYNKVLSSIVYKTIYERFLRSERLLRLLLCYDNNISPYIDEKYNTIVSNIGNVRNIVFRNQNLDECQNIHIYPQPHMPDVKTNNEAYLACSLNGGLAVDKNTGYRNVNLLIDIVVPDTKNVIKSDNYECQFSYRVYDLMYEIDKLLNNKISDYGIVNKIYYIGFQRRDYSDDIHGVQMTYNMQINSNVDFVSQYQNLAESQRIIPH